MESKPYGPIDRLFDVFPPPPAPPLPPTVAATPEVPGFQFKAWHFIAGVAGLGLVVFVIWKFKESQKKKKLELTQI